MRWTASIVGAIAAALLVAPRDASAALSLSTSAAPGFTVALNGTDRSVTYALPMTVTDTTGTGAGWHLNVTSTTFGTGGAPAHELPATASSITAATASCAVQPCTDPVDTVTLPVALPAGSTAPPPSTFFNAQANSGMGEFTVTPTVSVAIPANAYAGTYTSTLTLGVVSGP